jgi:replicative DNA helicase
MREMDGLTRQQTNHPQPIRISAMSFENPYLHFNEEIEQAVLGGMLSNPDICHEYIDQLCDEHFYVKIHKTVFSAITTAYDKTNPVDIVTVEGILRNANELDNVGKHFLPEIIGRSSSYTNVSYHFDILAELAVKRKIAHGIGEILSKIHMTPGYDVLDMVSKIATESEAGAPSLNSFTPMEIIIREESNAGKVEKLQTGELKLDGHWNGDQPDKRGIYEAAGLYRGQVDVTIADSGHGKTRYAMWKAALLANRGYKVHWFQLEDYDLTTAKYFKHACPEHHENILICDGVDEIEAIKRETRRMKREFATDYVVIDYVQNVQCNQRNRADQVEYISRQITRMAKDLNVAMHMLSQITIDYNKRFGWAQEPRFGDVRWSQQIKQDAHIITSVFRPSRIEGLVINQTECKNWKDQPIPINSVFVRQCKVRGFEQLQSKVHLIDSPNGLHIYEDRYGDFAGYTPVTYNEPDPF